MIVMDDRLRKYVMIGISICAMGAFVFYEFYSSEGGSSHWVNPKTLDQSPSKRALNEQRKQREREDFQFDRKVSSLDHFMETAVEKDPFDSMASESGSVELEEGSSAYAKASADKEVGAIGGGLSAKGEEQRVQRDEGKAQSAQRMEQSAEVVVSRESGKVERRTGFASGGVQAISEEIQKNISSAISVLAVVQEDAVLQSGSVLKLRTLAPFTIKNVIVPENTFVFGQVTVAQDKIQLSVTSLVVGDRSIPIELTAYDMSGNEGLLLEGGLNKEIEGDALGEAVNEIQRNVDIPVLRNVPFRSARKKVRAREVPMKAGYKMYLKGE